MFDRSFAGKPLKRAEMRRNDWWEQPRDEDGRFVSYAELASIEARERMKAEKRKAQGRKNMENLKALLIAWNKNCEVESLPPGRRII